MHPVPLLNPVRRRNPPTPWQIGAAVAMAAVGVGGLIAGAMRSTATPTPTPPAPSGSLGGGGPVPSDPSDPYHGLTPEQVQAAAQAALGAMGRGDKPPKSTANDIQQMRRGPAGPYTSWFNEVLEQQIIRRLQQYRTRQGITQCVTVTRVQDPSVGEEPIWFAESEAATRQVLDAVFPVGAPWNGEQFLIVPDWNSFSQRNDGRWMSNTTPSIPLWKFWLWNRVMALADREVCQYVPVT